MSKVNLKSRHFLTCSLYNTFWTCMYHVHSATLDKTMNKTVLPSSRAYPKGALSMLWITNQQNKCRKSTEEMYHCKEKWNRERETGRNWQEVKPILCKVVRTRFSSNAELVAQKKLQDPWLYAVLHRDAKPQKQGRYQEGARRVSQGRSSREEIPAREKRAQGQKRSEMHRQCPGWGAAWWTAPQSVDSFRPVSLAKGPGMLENGHREHLAGQRQKEKEIS